MKTLRVATLSGAVLDAFSTISIAAIAVMLGFRLVDGSLTLFPALFVLVLMPDYFRPIREFASDYHASLDGKNSLHSVLAIINAPQSTSKENSASLKDQPTLSWSNDSTLHLDNLSFRYQTDDAFTLENISASFSGAQIVGIIGQSGSGKSTLAHLLAGLSDPTSGFFTLNDNVLPTLRCSSWQNQLAIYRKIPIFFMHLSSTMLPSINLIPLVKRWKRSVLLWASTISLKIFLKESIPSSAKEPLS